MKNISYIKEKKEQEKRASRSVSLPNSLWSQYEKLADENNLNISDVVEEAMIRFYRSLVSEDDLAVYDEAHQEAYQTESI